VTLQSEGLMNEVDIFYHFMQLATGSQDIIDSIFGEVQMLVFIMLFIIKKK